MSANRFANNIYAGACTIVPLRCFATNRTDWFTLPANNHAFRNHEPTKPRFASYGARARKLRD